MKTTDRKNWILAAILAALFLATGYMEAEDIDHRAFIEPVRVEIRDTPHGVAYSYEF